MNPLLPYVSTYREKFDRFGSVTDGVDMQVRFLHDPFDLASDLVSLVWSWYIGGI